MSSTLELPSEIAGLSDTHALQGEVDALRAQLDVATEQMTLERNLAITIHTTRSMAIKESPVLQRIYHVDNAAATDSRRPTIDDILSSAYDREFASPSLAEGFAETTSKDLRKAHHPDAGGDVEVAQSIAHGLSKIDTDPGLAIGRAILAAPKPSGEDSTMLRNERYRLHVALSGAKPHFANREEAERHSGIEVEGAEWRVRVGAAIKTFELITGGNETWYSFLHGIVRSQNMYLINMVNQLQPAFLQILERCDKGDPIPSNNLDTVAIDRVFERIWSTIGPDSNNALPYTPPYQNWLEILLPALKMLDPGEKPGVTYTEFMPPIQVTSVYQPTRSIYDDDPYYDRYSKGPNENINYIRGYDDKGYNSYKNNNW